MRYLGRLADLAAIEEAKDRADPEPAQRFPLFWRRLLEMEMVARAAKHALNELLAEADKVRGSLGAEIRRSPARTLVGFMNAIFGTVDADGPPGGRNEEGAEEKDGAEDKDGASKPASSSSKRGKNKKARKKDAGLIAQEALASAVIEPVPSLDLSHSSIWALIDQHVAHRFRYRLLSWSYTGSQNGSNEGPALSKAEQGERNSYKPSLLRRVCMRLGLRVRARRFDWNSATPFQLGDVVDALPVPKGYGGSGPPGYTLHGGCPILVRPTPGDSPLIMPPFGCGNGIGPGGHHCAVPCPIVEIDEMLGLAQLQLHINNFTTVYELANQVENPSPPSRAN